MAKKKKKTAAAVVEGSMTHDARRERRSRIISMIRKTPSQAGLLAAAQAEDVTVRYVQLIARDANIDIAREPKAAPKSMVVLAALLSGERQVDVATRLGIKRQQVSSVKRQAEEAGISFREPPSMDDLVANSDFKVGDVVDSDNGLVVAAKVTAVSEDKTSIRITGYSKWFVASRFRKPVKSKAKKAK